MTESRDQALTLICFCVYILHQLSIILFKETSDCNLIGWLIVHVSDNISALGFNMNINSNYLIYYVIHARRFCSTNTLAEIFRFI